MKARGTYLSTVEIPPCKPIIIIAREVVNLNATTDGLDLADKGFPNAFLGLGCKVTVAQSDVDAGLKSRVESFDAVGG